MKPNSYISKSLIVIVALLATACAAPQSAASQPEATITAVKVIAPTPTTSSATFITTTELVNVHADPNIESNTLGQTLVGQPYRVIGRTEAWWQIEFEGQPAWVYMAFTSFAGDTQSVPFVSTPQATITFVTPADQEASIASIRVFVEQPDLQLTFTSVTPMPNSPTGDWPVAVYNDGLRDYMIEPNSHRVVGIDLTSLGFTQLQNAPALTQTELQAKAERLVSVNTPDFATLKSGLTYSEGSKDGTTFFFRWEKPVWEVGALNPTFAQVVLSASGDLIGYINTLKR